MTPKEKAKELFDKFYQPIFDIDFGINILHDEKRYEVAKQCALIAVDEIAKCTKYENQKFDNDRFSEDYWKEVKQEIEKL